MEVFVFLYTYNELSESEVKKQSHLRLLQKNKIPRSKSYQRGESYTLKIMR